MVKAGLLTSFKRSFPLCLFSTSWPGVSPWLALQFHYVAPTLLHFLLLPFVIFLSASFLPGVFAAGV